jgi:hypothetical protein
MNSLRLYASLILLVTLSCLTGCVTSTTSSYHVDAYKPASLSDVTVKVSLSKQNVYVMEGSKCLMATGTCVGRAGYPTPTGHFSVISKSQDHRSSTYGYWSDGTNIHPGASYNCPGAGWHYIGYPLAYWIEFSPSFGFHEGPVWPMPRSHGCLHIHEAASAKLFELVKIGTPVIVADHLPEDDTFGNKVTRPTDYADPDPAPSLMVSQAFFDKPRDTTLLLGNGI